MAALVAGASLLGAAMTLAITSVEWYEAAAPCLAAGVIFILHTRWALHKVAGNPLSAVAVTMSGIAVHFGVVVIGGLGLILAAGFDPLATLLSVLAAFAICQPISTLAIRRTILASNAGGVRAASSTHTTRTPFAEASA